jgi:hypothetical protein
MRASTSISKVAPHFWLSVASIWLALSGAALADEQPAGKAATPEEEDFKESPYTNYGEFNNQEAEEEEDTKFFQYGRFFGIGLGVGMESAMGNRGKLWDGGFPAIEFKLHYWFDFNFALTLDVYSASHFYDNPDPTIGHVDVTMVHIGAELKYYFDTKNLSSTITFANPYIIGGIGSYTKTETSALIPQSPDSDTSIGFSAGAGFEFTLSPKKIYLELEGRLHLVNFKDTHSQNFSSITGDDLSGPFLTALGSIVFTW